MSFWWAVLIAWIALNVGFVLGIFWMGIGRDDTADKTQEIVTPWPKHFMDEATLSDGPHVGRGNFHPHVLIKQLGQKNQAVLFIHGDDRRDQTIERTSG